MLNERMNPEDLTPALFPDGAVVVLEVKEAKLDLEPDEATGQPKNLITFMLATCNEERTTKGTKLPQGYPVTHWISLNTMSKDKPGKPARDIKELVRRNIAQWIAACGMPLPAPLGDVQQYVGKRVNAVMALRQDDRGPSNRIARFIAPAA